MAENEETPRRRPRSDDDDAPAPRRRPAPRRPRPRGDAEPAASSRRRFDLDDEELVGPRRLSSPRERAAGMGRREQHKDALAHALRDLPNFGKLLYRLARDRRVSGLDKALVVAALAYAAVPADYVPDVIPFLGELDDLVIIGIALGRLVNNAGPELLYEHWDGDPDNLDAAISALGKVAALIPGRLRSLLGRAA